MKCIDGQCEQFTIAAVELEIPAPLITTQLRSAFERGTYERDEINILKRAIRPGDKVLEVGAGVGLISTFVSKYLGAAAVWAIEANPSLIPVIRRTHELNKVSVHLIEGAAARSDGVVPFYFRTSFWASSLVHFPGSEVRAIPAVSLARIVKEFSPDVLIVDVEGGEQTLLDNLDLPDVRAIVVEMHPQFIGELGVHQTARAIANAGFKESIRDAENSNRLFLEAKGHKLRRSIRRWLRAKRPTLAS